MQLSEAQVKHLETTNETLVSW